MWWHNTLVTYLGDPLLWSLGGVSLVVLEMLVPGVYLLWLGLACLCVSFFSYFFHLEPAGQFLLFAVLAPLFMYMGRKYMKLQEESDAPLLNKKINQMMGLEIVLSSPIEEGKGRVKIGDSIWAVKGPDLPEGTLVRVLEVAGNTLIVRKV